MLTNYQRLLTNFGALLTWFAWLTQLIITIQNSTDSTGETLLRFFSSFSILTNLVVALFFTSLLFQQSKLYRFFAHGGRFTALVVYTLFASAVYQLLLRSTASTNELQALIDELLHTFIPVFVLLYWFSFGEKQSLHWRYIPSWSVFLLCYSLFILIRGAITNEYPYAFIDVVRLGYPEALVHALSIFLLYGIMSFTVILLGKRIGNAKIVDE